MHDMDGRAGKGFYRIIIIDKNKQIEIAISKMMIHCAKDKTKIIGFEVLNAITQLEMKNE